jgi:hypothetical protein
MRFTCESTGLGCDTGIRPVGSAVAGIGRRALARSSCLRLVRPAADRLRSAAWTLRLGLSRRNSTIMEKTHAPLIGRQMSGLEWRTGLGV